MKGSKVGAPRTHLLQEEDDALHHLRPLLLQGEECARRADEDLRVPVRGIMLEATGPQQPHHGLTVRRQLVVWPGELRDHFVSGEDREGGVGRRCVWPPTGWKWLFAQCWQVISKKTA